MTFEGVLQAPTETPEETAAPAAPLLQPTTRPAQPKEQPGAIPKGVESAKLHIQDIILPRTDFPPQRSTTNCSWPKKAYSTQTLCVLVLLLLKAACLYGSLLTFCLGRWKLCLSRLFC